MQTLKVSLSDMVMAFDNSSYEMTWYLNTETGEDFFVTDEARENLDDLLTGEATLDEVRTVIEAQGLSELGTRTLVYIPRPTPAPAYR
jgi:hypothetical protein